MIIVDRPLLSSLSYIYVSNSTACFTFLSLSCKDATMDQGPGSSQRMFADICKDICRFWTKGLCSTPGPTWGTSGTWWTSPWCHAPSPLSITPWRKLHICNSSQKEYLQWDSLETFIFLTKAVILLYFWSILIFFNQKSFDLTLLISTQEFTI